MHSDSQSESSPSLTLEPTQESNEAPFDPNYINNLPIELLGKIFDLHVRLPNRMDHANLKALLVLTAVCGKWRDVAISIPYLWNRSNLSGRIQSGLVELSLNRAQKFPQPCFRASHSDMYILDALPVITSHLDRWKALDLELGPMGESDACKNSGTSERRDWLSPIGENKASNLEQFRFKVCGPQETLSMINWGMAIMQYASELRVVRLDLPALVGNWHYIPWQKLEYIRLKTEAGVDVDNILSILSETPNVIQFYANLTSYFPRDAPRVLSGQGYQIKLKLPTVERINLKGMFVLETLRDLYSCIVFAPLLDNVSITCSQPVWDHESCLRLLDNAPAQIIDLSLEVTFVPEAMLLTYLQHPKVEPTLRSLRLLGSRIIEATLSESFHHLLTFSTDSQARDYRPLRHIESIDLEHCLRTTNGLLADMIESRLRRGDGNRKISLAISTSSGNPVDGYELDRNRLKALHHSQRDHFQDFRWFVEESLDLYADSSILVN